MPLVVYSGVPGVHTPVRMTVVNESTLVGAVITASSHHHQRGGAGAGRDTPRHYSSSSGRPTSTPGARGGPGAAGGDPHADVLVHVLVTATYVSFFGTVFVTFAWVATMASLFLLCPAQVIAPADFV